MDKKLSKEEIMDRLRNDENFLGSVSSVIKSLFPEPKPVEVREIKIFRCDEHHPADRTYVVGFNKDMVMIADESYAFIGGEWCYLTDAQQWVIASGIYYWCEL